MIPRILYVILGITIATTAFGFLMLWNANHDSRIRESIRQAFSSDLHSDREQPLDRDFLIGSWHGKESWGTTYVITRNADGSFLEDTDYNHADVLHDPPNVHSEGRWAVSGQYYSFYYTRSSDPSLASRPPAIAKITTANKTEIEYTLDEGNPRIEKQKEE